MLLASAKDRKCNPDTKEYRFIEKSETLNLGTVGWTSLDVLCRDNKVRTVKINGRVKTWKRNPDRIEVPIKYGMYDYDTLEWDGNRLTNGTVFAIIEVR